MLDHFSGRKTSLRGQLLPDASGRDAFLDDHRQRLRALDQLGEAAAQCGIRADQDRDFVLLAEEEVSLLESAGDEWARLLKAIRTFRSSLPIIPLDKFGFSPEAEDPFETDVPPMDRLGGGVEALAFADKDASVYKFFFFREGGSVGATFRFRKDDVHLLYAQATSGTYRDLLEKIAVLNAIGGMPTEITAITPEGILVAKQTFGRRLTEGTDTGRLLPASLISIPSKFLRCDRDHPRLAFVDGAPWLVADFHDRNLVFDETGAPRVIDLVAAPFPPEIIANTPPLRQWLDRVQRDPAAGLLDDVPDSEL